jgi:molybdate transport system substrate-binding protein
LVAEKRLASVAGLSETLQQARGAPRPAKTGSVAKMTNDPAQLNVLMSGGFAAAYEQLLPEFKRVTGIKVTTGSGASQGTGPQTIAAQLARGMPADVVILSREGLSDLIAANKIVAGTDVDLARVPLGVAVREGAAKPDVSTVEAFKQVLLKAKTVAIPGSTSGIWLATELFPRLGVAEKINVKAMPRGADAAGMVAVGGADLAVMPVSEIVHAAGIDFAGSIAPEIQFVQVFSAAVVAGSGEIKGSKRLIDFLASTRAREAISNCGMEPLATAR